MAANLGRHTHNDSIAEKRSIVASTNDCRAILNKFSRANNRIGSERAAEFREKFDSAIGCISRAIGDKAFRPIKAFNAAVFDAVMVGIRRRLDDGVIHDIGALSEAYSQLLKSKEFRDVTGFATAREEIIQRRIELATTHLPKSNSSCRPWRFSQTAIV